MPSGPLSPEQILALLTAAPPRLVAATEGLVAEQLRAAPGPDEWSANEVLAHLRSCADVWGDCIAVMAMEDRPTIRAINPRTWVTRTDYLDLEFRPSLAAFAEQRTRLLALLRSLPEKAWQRSATVTGAGEPLERTIHFYAEWLATHEQTHLTQVEQVVAAVGG